MAVFNFTTSELEGIAPLAAQEQYLTKFDFTPPPLPTGFSHPTATDRMTPPPSPGRASVAPSAHTQEAGFGLTNGGGEVVNKLVAKRNNKKRVQLSSFGGPVPSASIPSAANPSSTSLPAPKSNGRSFHEIAGIIPSRSAPAPIADSLSSASSAFGRHSAYDDTDLLYPFPDDDMDMSTDVAISALDGPSKGKRKSSGTDFPDDRPSKARTLGGDRVREAVPVRELAAAPKISGSSSSVVSGWPGEHSLAGRVPWPPLVTYLQVSAEGSEDVLEGRNLEDGCKS